MYTRSHLDKYYQILCMCHSGWMLYRNTWCVLISLIIITRSSNYYGGEGIGSWLFSRTMYTKKYDVNQDTVYGDHIITT